MTPMELADLEDEMILVGEMAGMAENDQAELEAAGEALISLGAA